MYDELPAASKLAKMTEAATDAKRKEGLKEEAERQERTKEKKGKKKERNEQTKE